MSLDIAKVLSSYQERAKRYAPLHAGMREVERIYNGEHQVTLMDMAKNERSAVPNLLAQGVDQMSGRIASTTPMVSFASDNPGKRDADRRALTAQRTITGWWEADRLRLKLKHRARHLIAYGMTPVLIRYDRRLKRPTWEVRSPLETFPSPDLVSGNFTPADCIFAYRRTYGWLASQGYGPHVAGMTGRSHYDRRADEQFLLLEYVDPTCHALLCVGQVQGVPGPQYAPIGAERVVVLEYMDNPSGKMNAVVPQRLSLSRPGGQFDSMIAMYYMQSRLMALEVAAVEKGVFPDTYLVSRPGDMGRFIDGPHDGRSGKVNIIAGGDIKEQGTTPGYMTPQTIDRLERAQRLTAGIPSEFGGEAGSNIRTGRRGDQVLSAVVDFPVGEAQEVMAFGLRDENEAAIALAKFYDGDATRTIYVGTGNAAQRVTYQASKVFTHSEHTVAYPVAGADVNALVMGLGQRIGMGTLSKETATTLDPFIDNPELEHDRIIAEGLEQALVGGLQQQAASGAIPPLVLSKVMTLVRNDKMELAEALVKVTEDAQKAQEAAAAQQPPSAEQAMAPGAQAAMAGPQSPIPGASEAQSNLAGLLTSLRTPQMGIRPRLGSQPDGSVAL